MSFKRDNTAPIMAQVQSNEPTAVQIAHLKRWRVSTFLVMLFGYVGYYVIRGNISVALPLLSQEFGYTNAQLGLVLTFSEIAYAIGKFTTGPLADQVGGKKIFLIGMAGGVVANFLFPLNSTLLYFTVIWCIARYFLSMGWGGIIKTIGNWYEPERNGQVMGLISINFQFGSVVAAIFCGFLISLGIGWKGLFVWPAAAVSVMCVISFLAAKESPQDLYPDIRFGKVASHKKSVLDLASSGEKHSASTIVFRLFGVPLFRHVLTFSFFMHILRSFFMFWIPKFMVDMGMGNVNAAFSSAVFPLLGCVGTIALGWYTDKYAKNGDRTSAMWKMLLGSVLTLAGIALIVPMRSEHQIAIVVLTGFAGFFLYGPYSMSSGCLSLDIAGSEGAGTCTGFIDGVGYLGGALAAWGAGVISDQFGWAQVFWTLSGLAAFTTAWVYYMSWSARQRFILSVS